MTSRTFTSYEAVERVLAQIPDEARDELVLGDETCPSGTRRWTITIADKHGALLTQADDADGTIALRKHAASRRWEVETGGVAWNGVTLPTDRERRSALVQALQTAQAGITPFPVTFGLGDTKLALTEPQLVSAVGAIAAHVQGAFNTWGVMLDGIAAGTIVSTAQIDAAFGL